MNSGIYALYWWEQDLVYIGLSQNLSSRCNEHFLDMRNNNHTNYRVQSAFNQYGEPEFIVLETCPVQNLPEKEVQWCKEFDALGSRGLCLVEPGVVGFGANSNASKYTKQRILKAFSLLYKGKLSYKSIQEKINVPIHVLSDIARGRTHVWLQDAYPKKYADMLSFNRKDISDKEVIRGYLKSPTGDIHTVRNITEFCRTVLGNKNHHVSICRVLRGERQHCCGYTKYIP